MKQKVLAYILREGSDDVEILVFDHQDYPEAGTQVPSGSVEPDEEPLRAVQREVFEESGLKLTETPKLVGKFEYFREDIQQLQLRHIFLIDVRTRIKNSWKHVYPVGVTVSDSNMMLKKGISMEDYLLTYFMMT